MKRIVPVVVLLMLLSAAELSAESALRATDGWIREVPPSANVRAGYVTVHNEGEQAQAIVAVRSDVFGAIEMHEMADTGDGVMRMRKVVELKIPAGETIELKPGGLHLMLFRPRMQLARGEKVPLILEMASGERIEAVLEQR